MVTQTARKKKSILIAEDDPEISRMLEHSLRREYEVHWAKDGREALTLAPRVQPDLLLLDVMMPKMNGLEASKWIRGLAGLETVPIIFLTALDTPANIITGIQHGARHYITKPFKLPDLHAKIRKVLKER
jgi:DNA-binding response OmpR family regulator